MVEAPHRPRYRYCTDPETCCHTYDPVAIQCEVDGEHWPCATKRSHCTPAKAARLQRWADSRIGRAPLPLWEQLLANRADAIGRLVDYMLRKDALG